MKADQEIESNPAYLRVVRSISRSMPAAVAEVAGALLLVPDNLNHHHRFEVLANLAFAGRARGNEGIMRTKARSLVDDVLGAYTGRNDDPWPTVATETFLFHGGGHLFIPGGIDRLFGLRVLASAISTSTTLPPAFCRRAATIIQFACAVSDDVLAAAHLPRNLRAPRSNGVVIPSGPRLSALRDAVRLTPERLAALLGKSSINATDAARFTARPGAVTEPHPLESHKELCARPLLDCGGTWIVAAPHLIAEAAARAVVQLARESDVREQFANDFALHAYLAVEHVLERIGMRGVDGPLAPVTPVTDSLVSHCLFQFDDDKVHHVMLITDAVSPIADDAIDVAALDAEIDAAQQRLRRRIADANPLIREWSTIVVAVSLERDMSLSIGEKKIETTAFQAGDLEAVAHVERPDSVLLWKFQRAVAEARTYVTLQAWSAIDLFAAWRSHRRRFPLEGDFVVTPSDAAEPLRYDALSRRDWHAAPYHRAGLVSEVGHAEGPDLPVYSARRLSLSRLEVVVEVPGLTAWVASPSGLDLSNDAEGRAVHWDLVRMVAFWLAEFGRDPEVMNGVRVNDPILVEATRVLDPTDLPAEGWRCAIEGPGHVILGVGPRTTDAYDDTNELERRVAKAVVTAALASGGVADASARMDAALDRVAPLGVKRMSHAINTVRVPALIGASTLPTARYVDDCDVVRAERAALGAGAVPTRIEGSAAPSWLNDCVGRLYARLRERLDQFPANALLPKLLKLNEALVLEDAIRDITFASQLACGHRHTNLRQQLHENAGRQARSALAVRFLIEHVSAEPPAGALPVSTTAVDECIAIAAEIVALGVASDVGRHQLAPVMIEAGHASYSIDLAGYDTAVFAGRHELHEMRVASEGERVRVPQTGASPIGPAAPPLEVQLLNRGAQVEFGRTLDEIGHVFGELIVLATEGPSSLVSIPQSELDRRLLDRLGWPIGVDAMRAFLQQFTLEKRVLFLEPPAGYRKPDIWPWIFNRSLSYLRRPLVRTADGRVSFTPGHLSQSFQNLVALCMTGRLHAKTTAMKQAMSKVTDRASREFNEDVAAVFRRNGYVTRTQVKKIAGQRIANDPSRDLGDVDVLAARVADRRILAAECKDLSLDRMPHEIASDFKALFESSPTHACTLDKHLARVNWLQAHLSDVVKEMTGGGDSAGWTIEGVIVTSRPMVSARLRQARLRVMTIRDLVTGPL